MKNACMSGIPQILHMRTARMKEVEETDKEDWYSQVNKEVGKT